jgi:DNA-binding beta-propeller fold protein YncE
MLGAVAGCGGGSAPAHPRLSGPGLFQGRPARAGCSTATAGGSAPTTAHPVFVAVHGAPFGVAVTANGRFAFVGGVGGGVGVFALVRGVPHFLHALRITGGAVGISLTPDGRYLLVADGHVGADVIDVARAETGASHAVLGDLPSRGRNAGAGAIEAASSPDGRYVFVSVEYGRHIAVYDLQEALRNGFRSSGFVGSISSGVAPVGLAVSPNGRWLYSTSEAGAPRHPADGVLKVIDLARAEHDPARSVVATVNAHCSPVRVAVSPDGATVWVTARESNQLLAFSAARLLSRPAHSLRAAVRVGEAPVGLAVADGGRVIAVADSNRFNAPGAHAALTVVSAVAALAHRQAILGTIRTGLFPREMAFDAPAGTLIVGNFMSDSLEAVRLPGL